MALAIYNFDLVQGDTLNTTLTATGINLNGYTLNAGLRARYGWSGYAGGSFSATTISGAQGIFSINMPATGTAGLYVDKYVYDVQMASGNSVSQIYKGTITLLPEAY